MSEEYIHVFKRNVETIDVTLEHILNNKPKSKEIIKEYFDCIRMAIDHCEELALGAEEN